MNKKTKLISMVAKSDKYLLAWMRVIFAITIWSTATLVTAASSVEIITKEVHNKTLLERAFDLKVLLISESKQNPSGSTNSEDVRELDGGPILKENLDPGSKNVGRPEEQEENPQRQQGSQDPAAGPPGVFVPIPEGPNGGEDGPASQKLRWTYFFERGRVTNSNCEPIDFEAGLGLTFGRSRISDEQALEQMQVIIDSIAMCASEGENDPVRLSVTGFASPAMWNACPSENKRLNRLATLRRNKLIALLEMAKDRSLNANARKVIVAPEKDHLNIDDMQAAFGDFKINLEYLMEFFPDRTEEELLEQFASGERGPHEFFRVGIITLESSGICKTPQEVNINNAQ